MNLIPEELKPQTFPCPYCGQYISSETSVCRFCATPIGDEAKNLAIAGELNARKNINLNRHKTTILAGAGALLVGLFMIAAPVIGLIYSNNVNVDCLTPVFVIGGIIAIIKGFTGYREEKRRF
jgi:hypothetical protein